MRRYLAVLAVLFVATLAFAALFGPGKHTTLLLDNDGNDATGGDQCTFTVNGTGDLTIACDGSSLTIPGIVISDTTCPITVGGGANNADVDAICFDRETSGFDASSVFRWDNSVGAYLLDAPLGEDNIGARGADPQLTLVDTDLTNELTTGFTGVSSGTDDLSFVMSAAQDGVITQPLRFGSEGSGNPASSLGPFIAFSNEGVEALITYDGASVTRDNFLGLTGASGYEIDGQLQLGGALFVTTTVVTASSVTLDIDDHVVLCKVITAGTDIAVNLPLCSQFNGLTYHIKKDVEGGTSSNHVQLTTDGTDTIDGQSGVTQITGDDESVMIVCDSSTTPDNWSIH